MTIDVKEIEVTRKESKKGNPMWTLHTAGGDHIYEFDNMLERQPWVNSRYRMWFEAMESGQTDRWMSSPILVGTAKNDEHLNVYSVEPPAPDAKPDKTLEPKDMWELYGAHWWNKLHSLTACP